MSYVLAAPEVFAAAASDVAGIGSSLSAANVAAAVSTTGVLTAAGDEVSAAIAALFSGPGGTGSTIGPGGKGGVVGNLTVGGSGGSGGASGAKGNPGPPGAPG